MTTQLHLLPTTQPVNRFATLTAQCFSQAEEDAVIALALEVLAQRHHLGKTLSTSTDTQRYLRLWLGERRNECFGAIFLTTQHAVLACEELFQGTIDGTAVHPRVVAQRALVLNAAAIICFHNHPSGETTPSRADATLTERLRDALAMLEVRLLDHIVVSTRGAYSFAEHARV